MKNFLIIWFGELISNIGTGMTIFALGVYIFNMTGSATAVSLFTLLAYLPTILLNPIGGVIADRFDRRLMMVCGDLFSAFGLIFIVICMELGKIALWQIYVGITISAIFISLLGPAYKATITDLLTEEEFAKASGLIQIPSSAKYLLSPVIAGFLLAYKGVGLILIIDISTIFFTVFTIIFVRNGLKKEKYSKDNKGSLDLLEELKEGWFAISNDKGVLILIGLMALVCFCVGFLQTLMSPLILSFTDAKTLGIIQSVSAIGILIGSVIIGIFSIKKDYVDVLSWSLLIIGIFMAGIGLTINIYIIIAVGLVFFGALPFANASADTLVRLNIPNEVQGRVWGLVSILSQIGYVVAYAISGVLADYVFGPMFMEGGLLADSIGQIIGVGEGRGIGFMLIISGGFIVVVAFIIKELNILKELQNKSLKEDVLVEDPV